MAGRFAPSPTGDLHLGNLRTAVIAWLAARARPARFVLRMEDLDRHQSSIEHERSQQHDLAALGLDWDGPVLRQSDRFDRYDDAIDELERNGWLYECYCTRREIREQIAAAPAAPHGAVPAYPGTCRNLTALQRSRRSDEGRPAALRLRGDAAHVEFVDRLHGVVGGVVDDVVVRRNDGVPAYNLAVVVDDDEQGVDQVVRGDDLIPSTPAQVHLQRLLGLATPTYVHVPLVVDEQGRRLAKRQGSVITLADLRAAGVTTDAVIDWILVSLGAPDGAMLPR